MIEITKAIVPPTPPYVLAIGNSIGGNTSGGILFGNSANNLAQNSTSLFWDASNSRLGIGQNVPTARLHVKGSGSTGSTDNLLVTNSSGTQITRGRDDGYLMLSNIFADLFSPINIAGGEGNNANGVITTISSIHPNFGGNKNILLLSNAFTTTNAGSGSINYIGINPTINQTAGSVIRGVCIFPTLTNAVDFRAIESTKGGAYFNTSSVNASAILQADSTTKGFLPPRMTTAQKNAIVTPSAGLMVFDTTLVKLCVYNGATWETVTSI